jgi:general secretion pathway protein A
MVLNYYKLAEQPFGVTPDPRFMFLSATHREAMASVLYGVKAGRGFSALIAEPGMGKTTVLFNLLDHLGETAKTAFLFQSHDSPRNFLRSLLLDLGIEDDGQDLMRMQVTLNECLVRETGQGKYFVVVVDEAQNLDEPVLEVVRMLSNFETRREKLMHIILAGQPQLAAKLVSPQMLQLQQRVSIVARLAAFNADETHAYIEHRLRVAGYRGENPLFTDRAFALIAEHSGGIPRNINNICFNALSLGCATQRRTIHAAAIEEVLRDLDLAPLCRAVPAANVQTRMEPLAWNLLRRGSTIFPKRWRMRAGIAALGALLAGIGFTVVARNPHIASTVATAGPVTTSALTPAHTAGQQEAAVPVTAEANSSGKDERVAPGDLRNVTVDASGNATVDARDGAAPQSEVVRIGQQDTLYQICMEHLGRYDRQVVAMIRELNPGFDSPRRLHIGQEIRIPTLGSLMARTNLSTERFGTTSAAEAKKP